MNVRLPTSGQPDRTFQVQDLITPDNVDHLVKFIDAIPYEFENIRVDFYASTALFSDPNNTLARMPVRVFFEVGQLLERSASGYRPVDWEILGRQGERYLMSFVCRPVHFIDLVGLPG
jgi:hypothetical protein